jgi:hypothetical protein
MLRASLGKVVHTVQRAGTFAVKVSPQELHKIAVHVRAVGHSVTGRKFPCVQTVPCTGQGEGFLCTVRNLNTHVRDSAHPAKIECYTG